MRRSGPCEGELAADAGDGGLRAGQLDEGVSVEVDDSVEGLEGALGVHEVVVLVGEDGRPRRPLGRVVQVDRAPAKLSYGQRVWLNVNKG